VELQVVRKTQEEVRLDLEHSVVNTTRQSKSSQIISLFHHRKFLNVPTISGPSTIISDYRNSHPISGKGYTLEGYLGWNEMVDSREVGMDNQFVI